MRATFIAGSLVVSASVSGYAEEPSRFHVSGAAGLVLDGSAARTGLLGAGDRHGHSRAFSQGVNHGGFMRPAGCILAALSLVPAMTARAQEPWIAEPGQRVRVSYDCPVAAVATGSLPAGCHRAVGTLVGLRGDTLTISGGASTTSYPLSTVTRLELSRGRKSHWLAGAGVGLLVGTGAAIVALNSGSSSTDPCDTEHNQDWSRLACLGFTAGGGVVGGLIGGVVGLALKTDRWEEAPRDRLRVSIAPYRDGVVLGASLRF